MAKGSVFMMLAVLANLSITVPDAHSQDFAATVGTIATGIRTDRLKPGHLKLWKAMERIMLAVDHDGRPVHPMLLSLWQWAQQSRHAIYLEMYDHEEALHCSAGEFRVENSTQEMQNWTGVIRLNLSIIQAASAKEWIDGSSRMSSLRGAGRNARCAGFLAHELVHASLILENPEYARIYQEFKWRTVAYYLARKRMTAKEYGNNTEMQISMKRLQSLIDQLEAPAHAVERDLWHELIPGMANGVRR